MIDSSDQRIRLSLSQLEVFVATVREGTTRAAADRIGRSQSAASDALADLEITLGVQLFDRVGRRLLLNENGRALMPRASALLGQAIDVEVMFSLRRATALRMASSYTVGEYLLPGLIGRWKALHPDSRVQLDIANTRHVLDAVAAFEADIGFIEGGGAHPDLVVRRWREDELIVVTAPGHPFAAAKPSRRKLEQATWIVREQGSGTREASDRWLTAALGQFQVELELGSNEAVKRAVASGLGVGCLSRLAVASALDRGELVEIRTGLPVMHRMLAIVTHATRPLGETAQAFLTHCVDEPDAE